MKKLRYVVIITLCLFACQACFTNTIPDNSQTGTSGFGCKMDGEVWTKHNYLGAQKDMYFNHETNTMIYVIEGSYNGEYQHPDYGNLKGDLLFTVKVNPEDEFPKAYSLGNPEIIMPRYNSLWDNYDYTQYALSHLDAQHNFAELFKNHSFAYTTESHENYIEITKFEVKDKLEKGEHYLGIISGTFKMTLVTQDGNNEIIVTEGVFDERVEEGLPNRFERYMN